MAYIPFPKITTHPQSPQLDALDGLLIQTEHLNSYLSRLRFRLRSAEPEDDRQLSSTLGLLRETIKDLNDSVLPMIGSHLVIRASSGLKISAPRQKLPQANSSEGS